jgi:hypothetical protein
MNRTTIIVALLAGLIGGAISRFISPAPVLAQQAQAPNSAPVELRAQRISLIDPQGSVVATFTIDQRPTGGLLGLSPSIRLLDAGGREIWRAGGNPVRPLALK